MDGAASRRFETVDLAEAVEIFSAMFTGGNLLVSDYHNFSYIQDFVAADGLTSLSQRLGARVTSSASPADTFFVAWTNSGSTSYRIGQQRLDADAGVLWSGRRPIEADVDQAEVGSLVLQRAEFETRAARILGRDSFILPDFAPLVSRRQVDVIHAHARSLRSYLTTDALQSSLVRHSVQDLTVALILQATGLDEPIHESRRTPANIRRAMTFIDDNLERQVSLGEIAAASGLSARGLNAAFRRVTGETPMGRLRRVRLSHARSDLLSADLDQANVEVIARRWGFNHLGRFAILYRESYGESPSQTLRT